MATAFSDPSSMISCISSLCSLEPEDILNEILQEKRDSPLICGNCDEVAKATSRCKDCEEFLCSNCVRAHIRVKLTKDHCIISLEDYHHLSPSSTYSSASNVTTSGNSPSSISNGNNSNNSIICDLHHSDTSKMYCDTCCALFCQECNSSEHRSHSYVYMQEAVDVARTNGLKHLTDAKMSAQALKECIDISQRMLDTINARSLSVTREVRHMMRRFQLAIEERERELVTKVERLRMMKYKLIHQQIESFRTLFTCYNQTTKTITEVLEMGSPLDIIQARESIAAEVIRLRSLRTNIPHVDDTLSLIPPDCSVLIAVRSMGDISASNFNNTGISDELIRSICTRPPLPAYQNRQNSFFDDFSNITDNIPPHISPEKPFKDPSKFQSWAGVLRNKEHPSMLLKGSRMRNSLCSGQRDYSDAGDPVLILGGEGEGDGQLCRPWGVCCTAEGNIVVADRSNNRIQIFRPDGSFLLKFGHHGCEPGYFDRPAGVAVDPLGRIIVTDKDNHRIQIFTQDGLFIFTFGEKGSKAGQFNYPWDVAVDSQGRIVVSDTRNHRIQLFDNDGLFIAKYGFENTTNMVKHFDSPRGVCFGAKGCVIATDFNNHRLVVIDPNFRNAKFLGTEGCGEKQFLRPQGVAVDPAGNIIVADSRNNRIQIFEQNGSFLREFGTAGKDPGRLDRPSGVCLTPSGKIVVVDFGNNRIQVF